MATGMDLGGGRQITPEQTYHPTYQRTGWSIFGGILLGLLGIVNLIHGVTLLEYDEYIINQLVFEEMTFWGWAFAIWGVLQIIGGALALWGSEGSALMGLGLASMGAIGWFFMIFAAPASALVGIGLSVVIIFSLATSLAE